MAIGWFSVHRQLLDSPGWLKEPFTRGQAWIDLIGLANHEPGYIRVRGNRINIKRGQVGWSIKALAKRWKWSRGKVARWFEELENMEHQIEQQKSVISSVVTITNYDKYQQMDSKTDSRRTADGQQTDTNNNGNKGNNGNKLHTGRVVFKKPTPEEVTAYAKAIDFNLDGSQFVDYYITNGWMVGRAKMKDWKAAVRTWKRRRATDVKNNGSSESSLFRTAGEPGGTFGEPDRQDKRITVGDD